MAVYVDDMTIHGWGKNVKSCHLLAIPPDDPKLHVIAKKAGLKREWFQNGSWPHYDLKGGARDRAIKYGAVRVDNKTLTKLRIDFRQAIKQAAGE